MRGAPGQARMGQLRYALLASAVTLSVQVLPIAARKLLVKQDGPAMGCYIDVETQIAGSGCGFINYGGGLNETGCSNLTKIYATYVTYIKGSALLAEYQWNAGSSICSTIVGNTCDNFTQAVLAENPDAGFGPTCDEQNEGAIEENFDAGNFIDPILASVDDIVAVANNG